MPEIFEFDLTKLSGGFETRNAGVFEVICSKKEKKFEPFVPAKATAAAAAANDDEDEDEDEDDDDDLFGDSDDDDEDEDEDPMERLERLAAKGDKVAIAKLKVSRAKAAKAAKKEAAGRTMLILEIKPFDDETNLKALEKEIRQINADELKGLCLWGVEGEFFWRERVEEEPPKPTNLNTPTTNSQARGHRVRYPEAHHVPHRRGFWLWPGRHHRPPLLLLGRGRKEG